MLRKHEHVISLDKKSTAHYLKQNEKSMRIGLLHLKMRTRSCVLMLISLWDCMSNCACLLTPIMQGTSLLDVPVLVSWFYEHGHNVLAATVEDAVFGAESVAMKHSVEPFCGTCYEQQMIDVDINCPTYIYGDNKSTNNNISKPESYLKKELSSICYHFVNETVAKRECLTIHIQPSRTSQIYCQKGCHGKSEGILLRELVCVIPVSRFDRPSDTLQ